MKIETRIAVPDLTPQQVAEVKDMVRARFQSYIQDEWEQMVDRLLYGDHRTRLHGPPIGITGAGVVKWVDVT